MKIYKLTDPRGGYDEIRAIVVRAATETDARAIVAREGSGENADDFGNPTLTTCEVVTTSGEPGIICTDVLEG